MTADRKTPVDWSAIEADYRAGSMSLREVAGVYGITEGAIRKRAKARGWSRVAKHITSAELAAAGRRRR